MVNDPKGAKLASELVELCALARAPHERLGFEVRGHRRWLTPNEAFALDVSALRGAARHRREEVRKASVQDRQHDGRGVNTIIQLLKFMTGAH
jgi:hypothetical protein